MNQHRGSTKIPFVAKGRNSAGSAQRLGEDTVCAKKIRFAVLVCALILFAGACSSTNNGPTATASDAPSSSVPESPVC